MTDENKVYPFNPYFKQTDQEKKNGFNQGYQCTVNGERIDITEVARLAHRSRSYTLKWIKNFNENPDAFIARGIRSFEKRSKK